MPWDVTPRTRRGSRLASTMMRLPTSSSGWYKGTSPVTIVRTSPPMSTFTSMSFSVPATRVAARTSPTRMLSFRNSSIEIVLTVSPPPVEPVDASFNRRCHIDGHLAEEAILAGLRPARRHPPVEMPSQLRQRAIEQVSVVVGQVGVEAVNQPRPAEVPVLAKRNLAQEEVPHGVDAYLKRCPGRRSQFTRHPAGVDHVPQRLAALLPLPCNAAVDEALPRRIQPGRDQHRRPEQRVKAVDVFADEVMAGRPPAAELRLVIAKAHSRDVVGQRIEPDVDDMGGVIGDRDAPREFLHRQ